jgi:hypothetical protein
MVGWHPASASRLNKATRWTVILRIRPSFFLKWNLLLGV